MELAHWGFQYWPFERTFSAARFFAGAAQEEAMARLLFLVEENRRSGIVLGPSGAGKTYLLTLLQQRAERLGRQTVRCDATGCDAQELISQIALALHVACQPEAAPSRLWHSIRLRFDALAIVQQSLVVIVDHFDDVHSQCHGVLCRLIQLAESTGVRLTLILATRDPHAASSLAEIIELRIDLGPWGLHECSAFISSAILRAGSNTLQFSDAAVSLIYELTRGVPSRVVSLCHLALLAAQETGESTVTHDIIRGITHEVPPLGDHSNREGGVEDTSRGLMNERWLHYS